MKDAKNKDLEDMVYKMQLTYDEIVDMFDIDYIGGSTKGYTLPPGLQEITDNTLKLKSSLPIEVKVKKNIDKIRLKSSLTTNETIKFTKKSFFYTIPGSTQSSSGLLDDNKIFIQVKPGTYKSDKPINVTGIHKIHSKSDRNNGSSVNGVRKPILYLFLPSISHQVLEYLQKQISNFLKQNK